jgi:hypothetical protein
MYHMDEHARRVVQRVLEAAAAVQERRASIASLQTATAGAAGALDNSSADIRAALERLDSDLEMIRFTVGEAHQAAAIRQAVGPLRVIADLS